MLKDTFPTPNASSSKEQSSSHLSTSCSRCQSLKTGDSLHLTLAYRKCRCHRQFEHHDSKARPTAVNSTPTSSRSRIAELLPVAGSTLALSLPPIDLITSAKSCQQTSDHTAKKITEGNSCFTERLPSIVRKMAPSSEVSLNSSQMKSLLPAQHKTSEAVREITELRKYIPHSKQAQLISKFTILDKNGDGHLTFDEFLKGLPNQGLGKVFTDLLQQFYNLLSESTYFGRREFVICYCIAEVLLNSSISQLPESSMVFQLLKPFVLYLSEYANGGRVTFEDLQNSVARVNEQFAASNTVSVSLSSELQLDAGTFHMLDCMALGPFYLRITSQHAYGNSKITLHHR
eukprot:Em0016g540a